MKKIKKFVIGTLLLVGVSFFTISSFALSGNEETSTISVRIDQELCVGCGTCVETSDDLIFDLIPGTNKAMFSINVPRRQNENTEYYNVSWLHSDDVQEAIDECPVDAILYF